MRSFTYFRNIFYYFSNLNRLIEKLRNKKKCGIFFMTITFNIELSLQFLFRLCNLFAKNNGSNRIKNVVLTIFVYYGKKTNLNYNCIRLFQIFVNRQKLINYIFVVLTFSYSKTSFKRSIKKFFFFNIYESKTKKKKIR